MKTGGYLQQPQSRTAGVGTLSSVASPGTTSSAAVPTRTWWAGPLAWSFSHLGPAWGCTCQRPGASPTCPCCLLIPSLPPPPPPLLMGRGKSLTLLLHGWGQETTSGPSTACTVPSLLLPSKPSCLSAVQTWGCQGVVLVERGWTRSPEPAGPLSEGIGESLLEQG